MTGFKPWSSGVGSNSSADFATTTAHKILRVPSKKWFQMVEVVPQLVDGSLPTPEIRGSNPIIGKFCSLSTISKIKKKRPGMAHLRNDFSRKLENIVFNNLPPSDDFSSWVMRAATQAQNEGRFDFSFRTCKICPFLFCKNGPISTVLSFFLKQHFKLNLDVWNMQVFYKINNWNIEELDCNPGNTYLLP